MVYCSVLTDFKSAIHGPDMRKTISSKISSIVVIFPLLAFNAVCYSFAGTVEPGPLENYNGAYAGDILVDSPATGTQSGAVIINQSDITTSLTGNIHINSGSNYSGTSDRTWAHGLRVNGALNDSVILLSTAGADDMITIDVHGYTGSGVRVTNASGETGVIIDATSSTQKYGLVINLFNPTDEANNTQEAGGFYVDSGKAEAKGNILITTTQARGYGYWANTTGVIEITGNTDIITTGAGSYGIRGGTPGGNSTASIIHTGDLNITTSGGITASSYNARAYGADGIRMQNGTSLTVGGKTTVNTSGAGAAGIHGMDTSVISLGDIEVHTTGAVGSGLLESSYAYGIWSTGSSTITAENAVITTSGSGMHGVVAAGGSITTKDIEVTTEHASSAAHALYATGGNITTDKATLETNGANAHAIYATGGTITVNENLDAATANGNGVHTNGTGAKVYLNGDTNKITTGNSSNRAIYAQSGTIAGTGKFILDAMAAIFAHNGTVDLKMQDGTLFNGYTAFNSGSSTGAINLRLEDSTKWVLSQDSALTKIDVESGSVIEFNIFEQFNYTDITCSEAIMESGTVIDIRLSGYDPLLGDIFYLVNSTTYNISENGIIFNLIGTLGPDLYLYTGDFHINGSVSIVSIPEPASGLLGLSGLSLVFLRRRWH